MREMMNCELWTWKRPLKESRKDTMWTKYQWMFRIWWVRIVGEKREWLQHDRNWGCLSHTIKAHFMVSSGEREQWGWMGSLNGKKSWHPTQMVWMELIPEQRHPPSHSGSQTSLRPSTTVIQNWFLKIITTFHPLLKAPGLVLWTVLPLSIK